MDKEQEEMARRYPALHQKWAEDKKAGKFDTATIPETEIAKYWTDVGRAILKAVFGPETTKADKYTISGLSVTNEPVEVTPDGSEYHEFEAGPVMKITLTYITAQRKSMSDDK
jgi:hypothetical protein